MPLLITVVAGLGWALVVFFLTRGENPSEPIALSLGNLRWTRNDFCRGWYISGATGSGKTEAIKLLMHQLCRAEKQWGGLLIDEKGFFVDEVIPLVANYSRAADVRELCTRPEDATADWRPPFRFNILGDERVRTSQYVDAILMVAEAIVTGSSDQNFFKTQAGVHIGAAVDLFRGLREWQQLTGAPPEEWVAPTLRGVYEILTSEEDFEFLVRQRVRLLVETSEPRSVGTRPGVEKIEGGQSAPTSERAQRAGVVDHGSKSRTLVPDFQGVMPATLLQALDHFSKRYWNVRAQEQMEGIKGTITNYLRWFVDDAIHEVFGAEQANFTMACMDEGKLICLSLPQRYAIERRYLCALLKVLAYAHARARLPTRRKYNLLVIWQDEAQRFILPIDGDVDILRQYQVTTVISTQFRGQLEKALRGREQAAPIIGNLRNRIILQAADEDCAEESAKHIGRGIRRKRSYTQSPNGSRSVTSNEEIVYLVEPYQLRQLPKFVAVFCHAAGMHRVWQFTPLDEKGEVPKWFRTLATSAMRRKMLFRKHPPIFCHYTPPKRWVR